MTLEHLVKTLASSGLAWPDGPTVSVLLGRPWTRQERRAWCSLLERTYGRTTLAVGWAIFGQEATLDALAKLQPYAADWRVRITESPSLAPVFGPFVKLGLPPPDNMHGLMVDLKVKGLSTAGWKWLCRQSRSVVRKLTAFGWTAEALFWVNLLAKAQPNGLSSRWLEAGRPYALGGHYAALQWSHAEAQVDATLQLERFLRQVPAQADEKSLWDYELVSAGLLLSRQSERWTIRFERNTSWAKVLEQLRRQQDERLKLAANTTSSDEEVLTWQPRIGSMTLCGVQVRELTDSLSLVREGLVQDHCVGNGLYAQGCVRGEHIIAALEEPTSGLRATLQLRAPDVPSAPWLVGQLAGLGNGRVPQFFWKATRALQEQLAA